MNIREFAQHSGLTAHTLRYYERMGLMGDVGRDDNGHRIYGPQDSQWVAFLHHLRETGMSIREMQRYCSLRTQGDSTLASRLALLERHTNQLAEHLRAQHDHLARLRETVAVYQARLRGREPRGGDARDANAATLAATDPAPRR
jgi:DNA-binding transcriptional MerR regulator